MNQGVLPYVVEVAKRAGSVTAQTGLPLVVETWRSLGLGADVGRYVRVRERESGYTEEEKTEALLMLMASGGTCLDDIAVLDADEGLRRLMGRAFPSADSLRRHLYEFHEQELIEKAASEARKREQVAYIPEESEALKGLARVNVALVRRVAQQSKCGKATVDHDATVIEAEKDEALWHYKGGRGYQPAVAYWAEQDLVLGDEFRDGNVPAGMGNLPLIKRAFAALPETVTQRYFRADSACYEAPVLKWLANSEREDGRKGRIGFSISADMGADLRAVCEKVPERGKGGWKLLEERAEETVAWADVEFTAGDWPKDSEPLRYVALRIKKKQGLLFEGGYETKYLAVVSNRREIEGHELIRWHWEKAGTIEHVHDVTKNELGAGVLPCGRFGANAAWYRHSILTYNVLSAMKSLALAGALCRARPKRLRFALFTMAGRIAEHAGEIIVRVSAKAERVAGLVAARLRLAAVARAIIASS
jgi:hypothetical protein